MIISRTTNGDIIKGYYDSSNILVSEYDKPKELLTVTFAYGGKYTYNNVSFTDFTRFEGDDSQGKILNSHIKPKYSFTNLGKVDVKVIKEEIINIYKQELKDIEGQISIYMETYLANLKANGQVDEVLLENIVSAAALRTVKKTALNGK